MAPEALPKILIAELGMQPHPEGGWYAETWRAEQQADGRARASAIYFLLEAGQRSHWHRVDGVELWLFHAGSPLELRTASDEKGSIETLRLGLDIADGQRPQGVVPAGWWQSTETSGGWALVSCIVTPGFQFSGFDLAPPGWNPRP